MTRALDAVARVRRVRERASLLGLRALQTEAEQTRRHLAHLQDELAGPAPTDTATRDFVRSRAQLLALGEAAEHTRRDLDSTLALAADARSHWELDHRRLSIIERLQERHAEHHRAEQTRREQQRLDEVALQLWARRTAEVTS